MPERLVILHGYTAAPESHWFPWLSEVFSASGIQVEIPALPDTLAPRLEPWVSAAAEVIGEVDEDLVILGHSLGCITALHALASQADTTRLGGLIMVSGFDRALATLPELDAFTERLPDMQNLAARTRYRSVITARDDDIVPYEASVQLAEHLGAALDILPDGGHFLDRHGHLTLPTAQRRIAEAFGLG
ncbi:MAG: serine hydrolase family protein [Actinobacteria bacterium]|nr:serine hydrolase family protein [Actinomycetota bacterium]